MKKPKVYQMRRGVNKHNSNQAPKTKRLAPRTLEEFFALPERLQDTLEQVNHVVTKMRADRVSLPVASREYDISPSTVVRWGSSALRRNKAGRYVAKASDRLLRPVVVLTHREKSTIALRDSRQATVVAEHWNAAHRYLETGDDSALRKLRRKTVIDATGKRIRLLTNLAELDRQGNAGVLSFESLYARSA